MKQANGDFFILVIIAIVAMVSKGLGMLKKPDDDSSDETPPPLPTPNPIPYRRPSVARPPVRRNPPVPRTVSTAAQQMPPKDLRAFMDRFTKPAPTAVPVPPKVAPPTARRRSAIKPPTAEDTAQPKPATVETTAAPVNPWTAAFRDRSNTRNMFISAEIIGPPRGA